MVLLLRKEYASMPDERFAADLLGRLERDLPVRRPARWTTWRLAAALGVSIAGCIGAALYLANRIPDGNTASPVPFPAGVPLGDLTIADAVGRSHIIVSARLSRWESTLAVFEVDHVIYGDLEDETVTLDMSSRLRTLEPARRIARERLRAEKGQEPGEDEVEAEALKVVRLDPSLEVLIQLRSSPRHPLAARGVKFTEAGSATPLDGRREEMYVAAIADGSAFEPRPRPGDILAERMSDAQLIARARLVQVSAGESSWRITDVLKGEAMSTTLVLDDGFFRLRARAIALHAARTQTPPPASPPDASRIDAETERLIRSELTLPREAILFVDRIRERPGSLHGRLRHRAYEEEGKQKLDDLQEAISSPDAGSRGGL